MDPSKQVMKKKVKWKKEIKSVHNRKCRYYS
jgi:hypothetical protein